jgi:hypothetical protein
VAGCLAVFVGLFGFLVGREKAGADPALQKTAKASAKKTTTTATPATTTSTPSTTTQDTAPMTTQSS